jgi:sulfatase modifying factor 1
MASLLTDPGESLFPDSFPTVWASEWGEDKFGLWMTLELQAVEQRFRWITPGVFRMGSPKGEAERGSDELQHEVSLTHGYWMGDTACPQALWQAVMGANPAHFSDDPRNPVEQVSWNDVQKLIERLNDLHPDLNARLPTEAEWEYACRAGTQTPFSFGKNVTPEQVNYNGDYPYAGGAKGMNRGRTVPVGSLPPNSWGLYEMHGNVWEWCADWYGEYERGREVDPVGPARGAYRVLGGGSWFDHGGNVRSAQRYRNEPGLVSRFIGFRLALGQEPGRREGSAGQARWTRDGQAGRAG